MTHVQFHKVAYAKMMLHAAANPTTAIHGILVGHPFISSSSSGGDAAGSTAAADTTTGAATVVVYDAIPVCHSIPTKPIVDMALRLTQAHLDTSSSSSPSPSLSSSSSSSPLSIVGWYTANQRVGDTTISPVICKILESIQSNLHSQTTMTQQQQNNADHPARGEVINSCPVIVARIDSDSFDAMLQNKCNVDGVNKGFDVFQTNKASSSSKDGSGHGHNHGSGQIVDESVLACECLGGNWKDVSGCVAEACLGDSVVLYDFENQLEGRYNNNNGVVLEWKNGMGGDCDWLKNAQVYQILE